MIFEMTDQPLWQQLRDQAVQDLRNNKSAPTSPAAQAVRNAYHEICEDYIETWLNFNHNRGLAAALRAAAKQSIFADTKVGRTDEVVLVDTLLAIADELEALND